jgi:3-methyladenine DNA glycosylase AlkD
MQASIQCLFCWGTHVAATKLKVIESSGHDLGLAEERYQGEIGMKAKEARKTGDRLASLVEDNRMNEARECLAPLLATRAPFPALGRIGAILGKVSRREVHDLLEWIAAGESEGGWVIIGSALGAQRAGDPERAFMRCKRYILQGDVWYATDILAERVPGPALVADFIPALRLLDPWRTDDNRWIRRAVGVAAHYWAKRSKGVPEQRANAGKLIKFLEPMFSEWEMDAAKGIGWGLKTLGKHYPAMVADWLSAQVGRRHRALMMRKAIRYLPEDLRQAIQEKQSA